MFKGAPERQGLGVRIEGGEALRESPVGSSTGMPSSTPRKLPARRSEYD